MADEKTAAKAAPQDERKVKLTAARDAAITRGDQAYAEAFAALAGEKLDRSRPHRPGKDKEEGEVA